MSDDVQHLGGDLSGAQVVDADLSGARFVRCDLTGAVMRAADVQDLEIEAPWLNEPGGSLVVNGVDVAPLVDAELDRRFPGRELRRAGDPGGLRAAWAAVERTWTATLERVAAMPPGTVEISVDGEWTFSQTLRHLVMATDVWLRRAVLEMAQPYHPLGQPNAEFATDGYDTSVFETRHPAYAEVLEVRAGHQRLVREHLAGLTAGDLAVERTHPWSPSGTVSTLACLHTVLEEEWEHHRYAVRDLDAIAGSTTSAGGS